MSALLTSLALFGTAWIAHLVWWRIRLPRNHTGALLAVFAAVPIAALLILPAPAAGDLPAVLAFYAGAAACYLIVYTGIEQTSPTLVIVRALQRAGAGGSSADELAKLITDDLFVRPRLQAMETDGFIVRAPGGWALTPRGRSAGRTANSLARIFGIRENA